MRELLHGIDVRFGHDANCDGHLPVPASPYKREAFPLYPLR